jgi:hypothetical protein
MSDIKNNDLSPDVLNDVDVENELHKVPPHKPSVKKHKSKKVLVLAVGVIVIALVGAVAWYFFGSTNSKTSNNQTTNTKSTDGGETIDPVIAKIITPTTGEVWLDKPIKIAKQGYFSSDESDDEDRTDYYQVGSREKNTIIMTSTVGIGTTYRLFEKLPDGKINYIEQPNPLGVLSRQQRDDISQPLNPKVAIADDVHYDSLSIPYRLQIDDKGGVVYMPRYETIGSSYVTPKDSSQNTVKQTVVRQLGRNSLVKVESTNVETNLVSIGYIIKTPMGTQIAMRYEPLNPEIDNYRWSVGDPWSSGSLKSITHGCNVSNVSVTMANSLTDSDVQRVGTSDDEQIIYEFKDLNNTLLKKAYSEFKDYYNNFTDNYDSYKAMSLETFVYDHGVVLYKDIYGQWLVYVRDEYAPSYGCAKPVVYLYPTATQTVSVKVGADVKISDPYYNPITGWKAVANPNGQLTVNGVNYDSLFWEGPGQGIYPNIYEGTVVKRQDAISTIKSQLAQQGLNAKETADFVDYWQDKLPNQPYIRLTWFNTSQMDQLAPLYIVPKPDTVIRVFLDASGLDKPINIPAQHLEAIPRSGFTVIEWGGLLGTSKMVVD